MLQARTVGVVLVLCLLQLTGCGVMVGTVIDKTVEVAFYPFQEWVFWGAYKYDNIATGSGAFGNRIKRFRIERIESDRVECELAFDTKVVSADLAHFFLAPIS